jgi:hypothetical protein
MARTVTVNGDDVKAAEGGGFKVYPAGDYIGEIIDVKAAKDGVAKQGPNKGKPAINVTIKFTESGTGEGVGKKFIAWQVPDFQTWASGSSAFLFFQFYKALGVVFPKAGESGEAELPDFVDIIGQEIGVTLKIDGETLNDDGSVKYAASNKVARFFLASEGVKVSEPTEADEEFEL